MNPRAQYSILQADAGQVVVVRDDMLPGGTKQRAIIPFLQSMRSAGHYEFVYASPAPGYAQVALARSCNTIGVACTIFAAGVDGTLSPSSVTRSIMPSTNVVMCRSLDEAERMATRYADIEMGTYKIPLGIHNAWYHRRLAGVIKAEWSALAARTSPYGLRRVWLPVGSGTLLGIFRRAVDVEIVAVDVGVLPESDPRIERVKSMPLVEYIRAPELFSEKARIDSPIPSNQHYDAKLWQFIKANARPHGDVWWNVAA